MRTLEDGRTEEEQNHDGARDPDAEANHVGGGRGLDQSGQRCLIGEGHRSLADELHQWRRPLQLGALDQLALVEVALAEADRAT